MKNEADRALGCQSRVCVMSVRRCNRPNCFNILPPGRVTPRCTACNIAMHRAWVERYEAKYGPGSYRKYQARNNRRAYHKNPKKMQARAKKRREELRAELLSAYGGCCSCCGEKEAAFLTLEHRKRDGKAHRMRLSGGRNNSWSQSVYLDLKRRGWPKRDYTILCFNCNHATWKLGRCPHKNRRKK